MNEERRCVKCGGRLIQPTYAGEPFMVCFDCGKVEDECDCKPSSEEA